MSFNFLRILSLIFLATFLISCAGIKPYRANTMGGETPTVTINDFKEETQKNELDQVIVTEKAPPKRDEFFIHATDAKAINKWVNYFSKSGKRGFETFLKNGQKYRKIIEDIFASHNLPKDLYYVGLIESGYKNHARSHAGAVGPWQFIRETARRYGLRVTNAVDERKNIYKSTQAAALYFQDLYNIFGSWELALAAYNAGEYGVIRRIRGANTRDFSKLSELKVLPRETRNYVPKIIAAKQVDQNRETYGVKTPTNTDPSFLRVKSVKISGSISLSKLAKNLKVSVETLKRYNHDLKASYIPYLGNKGFEIYIPSATEYNEDAITKLVAQSNIKEEKVNTSNKKTNNEEKRFHQVRKNESLYSISKRYSVSLKTLKDLNNIKRNTIYPGQKIYLPGKNLSSIKYSYIVKKGDHLSKIAHLFNIPLKKLKKINQLKRNSIFIGQKLKVPAHKKKIHIVKPGDILSKLASRYKTSIDKIKQFNNLQRATIYPGQKIVVELIKI